MGLNKKEEVKDVIKASIVRNGVYTSTSCGQEYYMVQLELIAEAIAMALKEKRLV